MPVIKIVGGKNLGSDVIVIVIDINVAVDVVAVAVVVVVVDYFYGRVNLGPTTTVTKSSLLRFGINDFF